jgi:hypothetical protein
MDNLHHPEYLMQKDTMEGRAEDSITVRLSGPGMYQWTLHKILNESKCEMISYSFCKRIAEIRTLFELIFQRVSVSLGG